MPQDEAYKFLVKKKIWINTFGVSSKLNITMNAARHNLNKLHRRREIFKRIVAKHLGGGDLWKANPRGIR